MSDVAIDLQLVDQFQTFVDIGISKTVADALARRFGAELPTPAQKALVPAVMAHKHIVLKDITGSGKSLGLIAAALSKPHPSIFTLKPGTTRPLEMCTVLQTPSLPKELLNPSHGAAAAGSVASILGTDPNAQTVANLLLRKYKYLSTIFILPTRELAVQTTTWMRQIIQETGCSEPEHSIFQCVVSGVDIQAQIELLKSSPPRILLGTPARLFELYEKKVLDTSRLQLLIVDEVDRIVDAEKRYETVKQKYNRHIHPLDGELLMRRLVKERFDVHQTMLNREVQLSPSAAVAFYAARSRGKDADLTDQDDGSDDIAHKKKIKQPKKVVVEGATSTRFDPAQARPLQIIVASATANNSLRSHLIKRTNWMRGAVFLDMNNIAQVPTNILHQAYIVDKLGNAHQVSLIKESNNKSRQAPVQDTANEESLELLPRSALANVELVDDDSDVYASTEEEQQAIQQHVLPEDHDFIVETLAGIIHREKIEHAFVFVKSSVSVSNLVHRLQNLGIQADKMINMIDYSKSTVDSAKTSNDTALGDAASTNSEQTSSTGQPEFFEDGRAYTKPTKTPFERFVSGQVRVICGTEFEARGLDLPIATHVFILGPPSSQTNYLHMAGRVGRFGRPGTVVTILNAYRFWRKHVDMMKLIGANLSTTSQ
eukprot:jgi/Hompol1/946/HPOL_003322-RA